MKDEDIANLALEKYGPGDPPWYYLLEAIRLAREDERKRIRVGWRAYIRKWNLKHDKEMRAKLEKILKGDWMYTIKIEDQYEHFKFEVDIKHPDGVSMIVTKFIIAEIEKELKKK